MKNIRQTLNILLVLTLVLGAVGLASAASVRVGIQIPDLGQGQGIALRTPAVSTSNVQTTPALQQQDVWTAADSNGTPIAIAPITNLSLDVLQALAVDLGVSEENGIITIAVY